MGERKQLGGKKRKREVGDRGRERDGGRNGGRETWG